MRIDKLYKNVFVLCLLTSTAWNFPALAQQVDQNTQPAPDISLTDYMSREQVNDNADTDTNKVKQDQQKNEEEKEEDSSWLKSMADKIAEKGSQVFSGSGNDNIQVIKRSNASVFDISGIMLRMDKSQVFDAMQKRGYKKVSENLEIPNFIRWRYEEQCRNQGIIGYERIANCVIVLSRKNNYQYVQKMNFNNFQTQESIEVYFTSNFTGNKVHRVMYQTQAANIMGSGAKAEYLRNIKIYDFWKKINQKYGTPDNREEITWGLGENKPSLKAATGRLVLDDPMLLELDYTRMSREDQKFMNTAVYTF